MQRQVCLLVFLALVFAVADARADDVDAETDTVFSDPADDADETEMERANEDDVEEIVVTAETVENVNPVMIDRIRNDHGKGARLYRRKQYAEAYPYLLAAAKRGFKLSQARVGFILQQGLGGIPRDGEAAIGWLGVAAEPYTSSEIRDYFKDLVARIPEEQKPIVDAIVNDYRSMYGPEATGVTCRNERLAGQHIARLKCDHEDEYSGRYRDVIDSAEDVPGFSIPIETGPDG